MLRWRGHARRTSGRQLSEDKNTSSQAFQGRGGETWVSNYSVYVFLLHRWTEIVLDSVVSNKENQMLKFVRDTSVVRIKLLFEPGCFAVRI